jgi:pimeloyl-ACP methyl ester carboxylesterase
MHFGAMPKQLLEDGPISFDVTVFEAAQPTRVVLFAVGGGGSPDRHLPLLMSLAELGCTVVAPHFERLTSPVPTDADLLLRARRLSLALESMSRPGLPVAGVGHSIGATMLLALAGGQVWMRAGHPLSITADERLDRLVLLAPATGFFQAEGALNAVRTPILAWAGTEDVITPPEQAELLTRTIGHRVPVDVRIVEGAGHFSFMNVPPPQSAEPLASREAFLADLTAEICRFIVL